MAAAKSGKTSTSAKKVGLVKAMSGGSSASLVPWLSWAAIVLVLDQFTKTLILGYYQLGDSTLVTSFFNIVRVHNHGAAFSFLSDAGGWQRWFFTGIGVVASGFMLWMLKSHPGQKLFCFAVSSRAVASGASWRNGRAVMVRACLSRGVAGGAAAGCVGGWPVRTSISVRRRARARTPSAGR